MYLLPQSESIEDLPAAIAAPLTPKEVKGPAVAVDVALVKICGVKHSEQ